MSKPSEGKLIYHITHINNMKSIIEKGLKPREQLKEMNIFSNVLDIADPKIMVAREELGLTIYNLFHFYVKNPFDCAICNKYKKEEMVILSFSRELARDSEFKIIPVHPLGKEKPNILEYDEGLSKVKWDILDSDNRDYNIQEIKNACLAECITDLIIPIEHFSYINVYSNEAKETIGNYIGAEKIKNLSVAPHMFP